MNEKLIQEIKSEIALCDNEIKKADMAAAIANERHNLFADRKVMLQGILDLAESEDTKG